MEKLCHSNKHNENLANRRKKTIDIKMITFKLQLVHSAIASPWHMECRSLCMQEHINNKHDPHSMLEVTH